jgi:hypothetical protein
MDDNGRFPVFLVAITRVEAERMEKIRDLAGLSILGRGGHF